MFHLQKVYLGNKRLDFQKYCLEIFRKPQIQLFGNVE